MNTVSSSATAPNNKRQTFALLGVEPTVGDVELWNTVEVRPQIVSGSSVEWKTKALINTSLRATDLLRSFVIQDPAAVARFLRSRPHLLDVLGEASQAIPLYFGLATAPHLELVSDDEEGWERLFLVVRVPMGLEELFGRSDVFHQHWVVPRIDKFRSEFTITEEPA